MKIQTVFSAKFAANTPTPSMRKLAPVAAAAAKAGYVRLQQPDLAHSLGIVTKLRALHDPDYVDSFVNGVGMLASSNGFNWTPQIREGVLAMNAAMLTGARLAMAHGIAASPTQGAHHARPDSGGGFCTFNFLALVAKENPGRRVFVLDCDQHGGNGTAEFAAVMPNLFNYSICGSPFGAVEHKRSVVDHIYRPVTKDFTRYAKALQRAFKAADKFKPGLVIYQAGMDCHEGDPMGSCALTDEQVYLRDLTVFKHFKAAGVPVLFNLAGGYQLLDDVVRLHVGTFKAAAEVWGGK